MTKKADGFTLVELIVVIAILGVLAGIVVPRFMNTTKATRGSKIIADINACESAVNIYYSRNGVFPESSDSLVGNYLADWPNPPLGGAVLKKLDGSDLDLEVQVSSYVYAKPADKAELSTRIGRITLGGKTIEEILSSSDSSLTLTD